MLDIYSVLPQLFTVNLRSIWPRSSPLKKVVSSLLQWYSVFLIPSRYIDTCLFFKSVIHTFFFSFSKYIYVVRYRVKGCVQHNSLILYTYSMYHTLNMSVIHTYARRLLERRWKTYLEATSLGILLMRFFPFFHTSLKIQS